MIDLRPYCKSRWKMNDAAPSQTVIDSQGYSDGTAQQNTEDLTVDGKIGKALRFNGTSDYIDTNKTYNETLSDSFTIALWCKNRAEAPSENGAIFGRYTASTSDIWITTLNVLGAEISYRAPGASAFYKMVADVFEAEEPRGFHFIMLVVAKDSANSATLKVYIDNVLKQTTTKAFAMGDFSLADNIYIGNNSDASPYYGKVDVDDVMIFNKALDENEGDFLWNNGLGTEELFETGNIMDDFFSQIWGW